jgi:nucleoside-diphosphate-sugar epimerase
MVFVTGATGILGRVVVLELLKRGKQVRAAKRSTNNTEEMRKSYRFYTENSDEIFQKIEWSDVDFDDLKSLQNAVTDVEEVYHCAAKASFHPKKKKEIYHTNIEGTKQLLYACENSSVKKFCFVSSIAVLDGFNEQGEMDENSDFNSKLEHSAYAKSKHFSEMEVWRASAEGLNTVIINPGLSIGSGTWNSSSGEMFGAFEKYPFAMPGSVSYIDVRDAAKIAVELMENNIFGERFILVSENKKYAEVGNFVRKKLGKTEAKILPNFVLKTGIVINFLFGRLFPKLQMMNKVNIEAVISHNIVSNKKIREKLNYKFIPVMESLDFHLKNYKEDNNANHGLNNIN